MSVFDDFLVLWPKLTRLRLWAYRWWFQKYNIDPESLSKEDIAKLRYLQAQEEECRSRLDHARFETSMKLALEARARFWVKLNPKILKLLRTSPTEDKCLHLKGIGKTSHGHCIGPDYTIAKDFALSRHRFIDGTEQIRCLICGKKWFKEHKDWGKMLKIFNEETTNTMSASETIFSAVEKRAVSESKVRSQEKANE